MSEELRDRILIIDDEASIVAGLEALLSDEWDVRTAGDGREARRVFAEFSPDVVLLDVQLPDIDGFEVAERISSSLSGDAPLVVLVSSRDRTDFGPLLDRSTARGFISKGELTGEAIAELLR
jgi:DNA-binding response OmpR family regulator